MPAIHVSLTSSHMLIFSIFFFYLILYKNSNRSSVRKRYRHLYVNLLFNYVVQNTILCVNYWVWNLMLQTFTCQPGFNYTIHNTTILTRCMRKLLNAKSHS